MANDSRPSAPANPKGKRNFAQVSDALIVDRAVTDFAVRLWCRLDKYAGSDARAFPHVATLADDLGVSSSKVDRGISNLVKTGWISRRRRGWSNIVDTWLNDKPIPAHKRPPKHRRVKVKAASSQVTRKTSDLTLLETSDLTLPETSDLMFPSKETHSKETHLEGKGRRASTPDLRDHEGRRSAAAALAHDRDLTRFADTMTANHVTGITRNNINTRYQAFINDNPTVHHPGAFTEWLEATGQIDGFLGSHDEEGDPTPWEDHPDNDTIVAIVADILGSIGCEWINPRSALWCLHDMDPDAPMTAAWHLEAALTEPLENPDDHESVLHDLEQRIIRMMNEYRKSSGPFILRRYTA